MKIYYKVVRLNLCSALSGYLPPIFTVKYKIGEWVYPNIPKTKLMVFRNLNQAINFAGIGNHIYSCAIKNPSNKALFLPYIHIYHHKQNLMIKDWNRLRKKQLQHKKFFCSHGIPKGTVFVSAVKLLEKIRQ